MFQDEIQANVDKARELEKLKPPKREKTPKKEKTAAELKKEAERKKKVDKNGYLAYQCQCRQCLYRRGFLDEGQLLLDDYNNV